FLGKVVPRQPEGIIEKVLVLSYLTVVDLVQWDGLTG
ncbi:hypothetical protein A2U01_0045336, partial [Trifolium medium]|nr:hypothetical protein [Trifolium medium]